MSHRINAWRKLGAYAAFFVVSLYIYIKLSYPGGLSVDSYEMLRQAVSGGYTNWHSVFLSAVWGGLYNLFQDTGPIWLIQISLYLLAIISFCSSLKSLLIGILGATVLAFFPSILMTMHYLWKDCAAVIGTLFVFAAALRVAQGAGKLWMFLTIVGSVVVCLIRIDYLIILAPFLIMTCAQSQVNFRGRVFAKFWPIGIFFVVLVASNAVTNTFISERLHPWYTIAIWDIAGVHYRMQDEKKKDFFSNPLVNDLAGLDKYNCNTSDDLLFGKGSLFKVKTPYSEGKLSDEVTADSLKSLWQEALIDHRLLYLKHRLCVAKVFLGFKPGYVHGFLLPMDATYLLHPNDFRVVSPSSNMTTAMGSRYYDFVRRHSNWMIHAFKYYWFLLLGSIAARYFYSSRRESTYAKPILYLLTSMYLAALRCFVIPANDFRYGVWIIVATICLLFLVADAHKKRSRTVS